MLILFILSMGIIIYQKEFYPQAEYLKRLSKITEQEDFILSPDTILIEKINAKKLTLLVTPDSKAYKYYQSFIPVRFIEDTVFISDTFIVAFDFVFHGKYKDKMDRDVELIVVNNSEAITGVGSLYGYNFSISRKRDGMMYQKDLLCFGKWKYNTDNRLEISEIKWFNQPPRVLETLKSDHFKLYFDKNLIFPREANTVVRLLETMYDAIYRQYAIFLPETIFVYLYLDSITEREINCYSNPFNTIWLKFPNRASLLRPERGSPIYTIAHEMARIVLQPLSNEYKPAIGADDWSHYAPLVGIVPYVAKVLGDSAWFSRYDYEFYGIKLFERIYAGAENTYAWLLYEIDKKYGKELIGKAIRSVIKNKYWRHPEMKEFMDTLAKMTGDKEMSIRIRNAYPTPFEHSLSRWKRWGDFGFKPTLEEMFIFENNFRVEMVVPNSQADSTGFKIGDEIILIDGFDLRFNKADAYKNLLYKGVGDKIIFTVKTKINNGLKKVVLYIK